MDIFIEYLKVFITGGIICSIGQILIDKTKLTSIGIYGKIVEFGGAGATVPISGFGYCLGTGVIEEINSVGFLGIFTGGVKACAAGICAAVVFGFLCALCSKPSIK